MANPVSKDNREREIRVVYSTSAKIARLITVTRCNGKPGFALLELEARNSRLNKKFKSERIPCSLVNQWLATLTASPSWRNPPSRLGGRKQTGGT